MAEAVVRPPSHPKIDAGKVALSYAKDVLTGRIVAGKLVRLACKRFIEDIKFGKERGLTFDKEAAQHAVDFFGFLHHSKGEWGGQVFTLANWQVFVIANIFGWKRADGQRRYREIYIEVARKNGKSTLLAGIALYMLFADDEPGAEVYSAATKKDQAKIVFDEACNMRKKSPMLSSRIGQNRNNLHVMATASKFEPLSSDDNTLDGLNIHCAVIDELHAHPSRALYDVLYEATASRRQPMIVAITTAGYNRQGVCFKQREHCEKILVGAITAKDGDSIFAYIACIDEGDESKGIKGDDWQDEKVWIKANPSLGISVKIDKLRDAAVKAKEDPSSLNSFLRKHLNVWTSQDVAWMPMDKWAKCNHAGPLADPVRRRAETLERLKGRVCFGGLDLSSKLDITAFVLLFPPINAVVTKRPKPQTQQEIWARKPIEYEEVVTHPGDPLWYVVPWFWVPEKNIEARVKKDRVPYDIWLKQGFLDKTPGATVDQDFIRAKVKGLKASYRIEGIGFDDWNATQMSLNLTADGFKMVSVSQTFKSLSEPMKELMTMTTNAAYDHMGNPVLTWMAGNISALTDPSDNIRPDKESSKEKIDGIVATIMSLYLVINNPEAMKSNSVYSTRGITFL